MKTYVEDSKSSTADKIQGNAKVVSGKLKEETGKVFRSPKLEVDGSVEQAEVHIQKKVGDIKKVFGQ
jgi:uncharacterized protein YjbJ (UPF0337 family)